MKPKIILPMERYLSTGETLQVRTGPHWIVFLRSIATAGTLLVVATALAVRAFESTAKVATVYASLSAGAVAVAFAVLAAARLEKSSQAVLVTDDRVVEISGVLRHKTNETRIAAVQNIVVDQSVAGRLLNFGTVTLHSANQEPMVLKDIAFPLELHQALQDHRTHREDYAAGA